MMDRLMNPKFLFGAWITLGFILGISFGVALGSLAVGLPVGLITSLVVAIVSTRLGKGISRLIR
ncbi:MAG: hypothetical protein H6555_09095 [Lewinellaceae bacterium]|nr:hypothetical protein [Lewinellaceae bacterium]